MKYKRKIVIVTLLFIVNTVVLSGCWNYKEINEYAIVSGLAIDKSSEDGSYYITFEVIDFAGSSKNIEFVSDIIQAKGKSIFDAARNAIKTSSKRLYWSHANIMIVSQEVAKDGVVQILDFLNRDHEPRGRMHILISREKTAKELLTYQSITTDIKAFSIDEAIMSENNLSKSLDVIAIDFINMLSEDGISAVLPTIGVVVSNEKRIIELSGAAMFSRDKLIGLLDEEDTKYLLFLKDRIEGGVITLKADKESINDDIVFEILNNKTKITPVFTNGKLSINISVVTKVNIDEVGVNRNILDETSREILKMNAENLLKNNLERLVNRVKKDYRVDIFGFGNIVKKNSPQMWKSIGANWSDLFSDLDINVNVEIELKGSGLLEKPLKIGD